MTVESPKISRNQMRLAKHVELNRNEKFVLAFIPDDALNHELHELRQIKIIKPKLCTKPRITRIKLKNIYKISNEPGNTFSSRHNPMYFIGFICVHSCHS